MEQIKSLMRYTYQVCNRPIYHYSSVFNPHRCGVLRLIILALADYKRLHRPSFRHRLRCYGGVCRQHDRAGRQVSRRRQRLLRQAPYRHGEPLRRRVHRHQPPLGRGLHVRGDQGGRREAQAPRHGARARRDVDWRLPALRRRGRALPQARCAAHRRHGHVHLGRAALRGQVGDRRRVRGHAEGAQLPAGRVAHELQPGRDGQADEAPEARAQLVPRHEDGRVVPDADGRRGAQLPPHGAHQVPRAAGRPRGGGGGGRRAAGGSNGASPCARTLRPLGAPFGALPRVSGLRSGRASAPRPLRGVVPREA